MHIKKFLLISAIAVGLSACGPNYDNMSYAELVTNAKMEMANAAKMKYLWASRGCTAKSIPATSRASSCAGSAPKG